MCDRSRELITVFLLLFECILCPLYYEALGMTPRVNLLFQSLCFAEITHAATLHITNYRTTRVVFQAACLCKVVQTLLFSLKIVCGLW